MAYLINWNVLCIR